MKGLEREQTGLFVTGHEVLGLPAKGFRNSSDGRGQPLCIESPIVGNVGLVVFIFQPRNDEHGPFVSIGDHVGDLHAGGESKTTLNALFGHPHMSHAVWFCVL